MAYRRVLLNTVGRAFSITVTLKVNRPLYEALGAMLSATRAIVTKRGELLTTR
ncbi:MAG: hypothetical protein R3C68_10895 [Myxococcota bacterium]